MRLCSVNKSQKNCLNPNSIASICCTLSCTTNRSNWVWVLSSLITRFFWQNVNLRRNVIGSGTDLIYLATHLVVLVVVGFVVSNWIRMIIFGTIVLQVNTHRLTESDFRYDVTLSRWRPWLTPAAHRFVGCPLARTARVTSRASCMRYSSWSVRTC